MARGRKPTPRATKELRGTTRPDRDNKDAPKAEAVLLLEPPEKLSRMAQREWDRFTAELAKLGLLHTVDAAKLWMRCTSWEIAVKAARKVLRQPTATSAKGTAMNDPAVARLNYAARIFCSIDSEFGGSPATRERLNANPAGGGGEGDGFDEWLERGRRARQRKQQAAATAAASRGGKTG